MKLRPYQHNAVESILKQFQAIQSTLAVLPTGTGKTVCFAHVSQRLLANGRVLVLAHREELIWQAANKIEAVTGHAPDIEMADYYSSSIRRAPIIVSSIQTQCAGRNGGRMTRFDPNQFSLVIVDEAHHAPATSYKKVIDYYRRNSQVKILGVTATPDRTDKTALGNIFQSVAFDYGIEDAITDGWLVPIHQRFVACGELDYSAVRTTAGDLNGADLAAVLEAERVLHEMVAPTIEIAGDKKTLFFAASVAQAERTAEIFNRHKSGCADCVFGTTPKEERRGIFRDFSAGKFNVLVNVGVATEGFDEPGIEVVAVGRPTKSRSLYCQMIGRGTRPLPGIVDGIDLACDRIASIKTSAKPEILILDFVGNSGKHKLVTTADILGGKYTEEVRERARAMAANGSADMSEALREADEDVKVERMIEDVARRIKIAPKATRIESVEVDAFRYGRGPAQQKSVPQHWYYTRASDKQKNLLAKFQVDASEMTIHQASRAIDAIAKNNWRKPAALAV